MATAVFVAAALVIGAVVLAFWVGTARAAGCEVLHDPRDRADCVAKEHAREQARAEVARRTNGAAVGDASGDAAGSAASRAGRSAAWQDAMDEATGVHVDEIVDVRLFAAIGGLVWFWLAWRRQRRARARA